MLGHPGGEQHSRHLIELAFLDKGSKWLDMGAGDGSTVRLLRSLGYDAQGIDLVPRGDDVVQGDYLHAPYVNASFDGIISQCSFYVSGNVSGALKEASRMLRSGGKLVFSDVTENVVQLLNQCREAGFAVRHLEDLTDQWREYYLEALWAQDNVCLLPGKKVSYVLLVCEKVVYKLLGGVMAPPWRNVAGGWEFMDLEERIMELSRYGYACGQILAILLLETIGEENPALVRCMQGLNGGIGSSGDVCGCMAAGCCLLSYFTGKPSDTEFDSPHHKGAMGEFTQWFTEEMELEYQSIDCRDIVGTNPAKKVQYCPGIIASTYEKCMEILESRGLL